MRKIYTFLNSIFICSILLGTFSLAYAGSYQFKIKSPSYDGTAAYEGIVPCGKCVGVNPSVLPDNITKKQCSVVDGSQRYLDCQLCHLFIMADDVLDTIMWRVVPSLAILFFIIAGFYYMASGDDPMKRKRANDIIKSTVIGILLIYGAWIIVNTIFSFTPLINTAFFETLNPTGWFTINCPVSY